MPDLCPEWKWELWHGLRNKDFIRFSKEKVVDIQRRSKVEQLSRVQLYRNLIRKNISESFVNVLQINIEILSGVEELFLTSDYHNEVLEIDFFQLTNRIRNNVERLEMLEREWSDNSIFKLRNNILKLLREYENKINYKSTRNFFNKLINELIDFNDKMIDQNVEFEPRERQSGMPQVFLSHAYDDKVYSIALFDYFYEQGIYLYVGWMHNEIEEDGRIVKRILQTRLEESIQLLFLRTLNSELDIQGKQMVRPWCAWELGNFYRKEHGEEKYLINLYSVDCYSNILIHGLKLYTGIQGGLLHGIEIPTPKTRNR